MTDSATRPAAGPAGDPAVDLGLTLRSLLRADFTVLTRSRFGVLLNLLVPVIFVVVTSLGKNRTFSDPGLLIGLSISYGLMSSGMLGYSLTVSRDRDAGVFRRLRVTPTPSWAIMVSRIVVQLVSALVMSVIVLVLGSILHDVTFEWYQYLGMLGVSLLGALMFLGLGQAVVGLFTSPTAVSAGGRVLYIVMILAGILGTTGVLGSGFQDFSAYTPVGALTNLYSVVLGAAWSGEAMIGVIMVPVYAIVFAGVGIRWFRWDPC